MDSWGRLEGNFISVSKQNQRADHLRDGEERADAAQAAAVKELHAGYLLRRRGSSQCLDKHIQSLANSQHNEKEIKEKKQKSCFSE